MPTQTDLNALSIVINREIGEHWKAIDFQGVRVVGDELRVNIKRDRSLRHPEEYGGSHPAAGAWRKVEDIITDFAQQHKLTW